MTGAGLLTERVQLLRKTMTAEDEGGHLVTYASIATVWARVRPLAARQSFAEDARGQAVSHAVVLRFRTDLRPGDRIAWRDAALDIEAVADLDGRRAYVSCQCSTRTVSA